MRVIANNRHAQDSAPVGIGPGCAYPVLGTKAPGENGTIRRPVIGLTAPGTARWLAARNPGSPTGQKKSQENKIVGSPALDPS